MKTGLVFPHDLPHPEALQVVQAADRFGYSTVWTGESYGFDALTTATQAACATKQINIGTSVVNMASRSPALIAQSAASLDMISGGRLILGLGSSAAPVNEGWHGVSYDHPLQRLREVIDIVRLVLRRERLIYNGEIYQLSGGLKLIDHPVRSEIPIYLGSITPKGAALVGEIADGWLPVQFALGRFDDILLPRLDVGAQKAGRELADIHVCAYHVPVVVTDDKRAGRDMTRSRIALYVGGMGSKEKNFYNDLYRSYGFEKEAIEIRELFLSGQRDAAKEAVSDEMIDAIAIVGDLDYCRERLAAFDRPGIDEVAIWPMTLDGDSAGRIAVLEGLAPRKSQ